MASEMVETHRSEGHVIEPIAELGTLTVYYGKGSTATYDYHWCPRCQHVYRKELMHGHGIRESRAKWAETVAASNRRALESGQQADAYGKRRRAAEGGA